MKLITALLAVLLAGPAVAAQQQTMWVCYDDHGRRSVQDHPCDSAQEQPPASGAPLGTALPQSGGSGQPAPTPIEPLPQHQPRAADASGAVPAAMAPGDFDDFFASHRNELIALAVLTGFVMLLLAGGSLLLRRMAARLRAHADERRVAPARIEASPELLRAWKLAPAREEPLLPATPSAGSAARMPPIPMVPMPPPAAPRPAAEVPRRVAATALTLERLRLLDRPQLEALCVGYWKIKGYAAAQVNNHIHLFQPAEPSKIFALVKCRAGTEPVSAAQVRELWAAAHHLGVRLVIVYSLAGFSDDAQAYAQGKHLKLFSGADLVNQIRALTDDQRRELPDPMAPA
ncbi:MAG TPA: restriction endonuclease [Nevskiaceae bacterium]|nr:restriction endonuclease [Nevskiaceae bacterium]